MSEHREVEPVREELQQTRRAEKERSRADDAERRLAEALAELERLRRR